MYSKQTGVGPGTLKILTGVLVHRVTRPLRGSVSCGSGWSVPCVSIQLTLSQTGRQAVRISRSRPALTPPALTPAPSKQASKR